MAEKTPAEYPDTSSQSVARTANEAIITIDGWGHIVSWNEAATTMFGYGRHEAIGKPLTFIMPKRFHPAYKDGLQQVVSNGRTHILGKTVELVGLRRDGNEFPVELSLSTLKVKEEVFFTGIVRDITDQVLAEALLGDRNQFITVVFESLGHPFYVVDADDYTIIMANSAAVSAEALEGVTCYALTHKRTTPCVDAGYPCPMEEIKKTAKPVVVEHTHYDSEGVRRIYDVHAHPIFDDEGKVKQIIEYTLDVTERKQMEEALRIAHDELELRVQERTADLAMANRALQNEIAERKQTEETRRESEERYRRLVELAFEAIVIHSQGKLVYVNPQAARLMGGVSPEEFIGKAIRNFVHPDYWDMVQSRVQQVGEDGKGVPLVEERFIRLDGTGIDVEIASVPITYRGQPAVQTVIHDISARKRAETERERERARIARNLHDSLGHNLGYLHLKLDELAGDSALGEPGEVGRTLAQMRDVANEAYELVRGMLAASLPSNSADLATALLVQARSVGQRGRFEVQLISQGQPRPLSPVVQQQLLYLLQEALNNVEKHAEAGQVNINLAWGEDALTVSLSDDGQGFDPGSIRSDSHFGLAIMQERAQEINGQLTLTSCPDMGTELVLRLPVPPASLSATPCGP
jgi:PAS domain S-box-containing protein